MQENVKLAKELFHKGEPVPPGLVRTEILASWQRSRAFGVQPGRADKSVLSPDALQARIAGRRDLYDIAVPLMESLHAFTTGSGFLTVACDEEGYVLRAIGDEDIMALARGNALVEGCNRSERRLGTNAIGTALEAGAPVQVFGHEHYYELHTNWVCSGAPVFDQNGGTVGVFCIIGPQEKVSFHTLGMAAAAAEAITRQLRMKAAYDLLDRTRKNLNAIIEYTPSCLLLLSAALTVKQANCRAGRFFGVPAAALAGKRFSELFGEDTVDARALHRGFSDRQLPVRVEGREANVSLSIIRTDSGEYLAAFEKAETLHKKVNRIIGSSARFTFGDIIGGSDALLGTVAMARIAAQNNSSVLLAGESGTGKELFAQAIHNASDRREGPFVAINCGALPKSLIESELFGYEGGSFTGAKREGCAGKFELANGGTIFLDEIGDMPFDVQVSLLRVLQTREVVRIGSSRTIPIDVRVIAATNQNLQEAIRDNAFRSDLFYRLNVFNIQIPPLRERQSDVKLLADYFLEKYAAYARQPVRGITAEACESMCAYGWPGNVRELENVIERAVYVARDGWIDRSCLPASLHAGAPSPPPQGGPPAREPPAADLSIRRGERQRIEEALRATGGNVTQAAKYLEISRRTLYRKLERYGIRQDWK